MKNFKKLLLACFILTLTTNYAQETKYGIRSGISLPSLKSKDNNIYSKDYESVSGFDISIFGDFGITENFSIKAELGYVRKGGERNGMQPIPPSYLENIPSDPNNPLPPGTILYANFENRSKINYIEIPILAKYEWNLGDTWGVYVNAGPYLDFMVNPVQETKGNSAIYIDHPEFGFVPITEYEIPFTKSTDIADNLKTVDFGAMFGVGVSAAISEHSELLLDVRGSYGFVPLQKDEETYGTVHMGNISIALGYAYTIPKSKKNKTPQ